MAKKDTTDVKIEEMMNEADKNEDTASQCIAETSKSKICIA